MPLPKMLSRSKFYDSRSIIDDSWSIIDDSWSIIDDSWSIIDDSWSIIMTVSDIASLTDDSRGVINYGNIIIMQNAEFFMYFNHRRLNYNIDICALTLATPQPRVHTIKL
jgi:hypothetical protein